MEVRWDGLNIRSGFHYEMVVLADVLSVLCPQKLPPLLLCKISFLSVPFRDQHIVDFGDSIIWESVFNNAPIIEFFYGLSLAENATII